MPFGGCICGEGSTFPYSAARVRGACSKETHGASTQHKKGWHVDAAEGMTNTDRVGNDRCGGGAIADQGNQAIGGENLGCSQRELFAEETGVIAEDNGFGAWFVAVCGCGRVEVLRDALPSHPTVAEFLPVLLDKVELLT